jgi:polysaccharide biosynthesis/export protein
VRYAIVLFTLLVAACGATGPYVWATQLPPSSERAHRAIRPGDKVQVVVYGQDTMSGEFEVRVGGDIILPVAGRIQAKDALPDELAVTIATRLRGALADPRVTAVISSRKAPNVSVLGEVTASGRYEMRDGDGVLEALAKAGGLSAYADRDSVYVIRRSNQASRIRFRYSELASGYARAVDFELIDGDVVLVQ